MERDDPQTQVTTGENDQSVITWTMFRSSAAMSMEVKQHTLHDLAQFLVDAGPFPNKASCPWVKLATFGNLRTKNNSLRHNANVVAISGVEGDYDGEQIHPEQAVEMLERYGIRAIIYTSPSHRPSAPRWRVLAPCSQQHSPLARTALLARVNGALGGILAPESFTLSQSYYFGEVQETVYRVYVTFNDPEEGTCVDEMDELDDIAITKEARRHANDDDDGGTDYSIRMFDEAVATKGRKLRTGDGRRELLKQYIASRSGRGLLRDEVLMMVEGVVNRYFDPQDPPDSTNLIELVDHFASKDVPIQPVDLSGFSLAATQENAKPAAPMPIVVREPKMAQYPGPFPGLMAEICKAAEASAFKPQPRLNVLGALVGMAASINGEYSTQSGGRFNLFGIGVLQSGGGKDMPRQMSEIVAACAKSSILGKPASGAGLEDSISDRKAALVSIDEMAHMVESMNDQRAASHLKDIAAVMLKLYSASRGTYNRRVLSTGSLAGRQAPSVNNPCLSVLGFATPDGLGAAFDERNLSDGLLGRMLFVQGEDGVLARRPKSGFIIPQAVYDWAAQLRQIDPLASVAGPAANGSIVVQEAHGVADTLDRLLTDMERGRSHSSVLAASLYARSYEKLERIAGVLAIMEDPQAPVLRAMHVEWARAFVLASDDHLLAFANERMHSGETGTNASLIRKTIRKIFAGDVKPDPKRPYEAEALANGCVARSHLMRAAKLDKVPFDRALQQMEDLGELTAFDSSKGKPLKFILEIELQG